MNRLQCLMVLLTCLGYDDLTDMRRSRVDKEARHKGGEGN